MTMVPSESGKQQKSTRDYVFCNNSAMNQVIEGGYKYNNNNNYYNYLLGSDHQFVVRHMAEEEDSSSRSVPNNNNTTTHPNNNTEAEAVSTSLKEEEEQGGGNNNNMSNWLQLSIGLHHQSQTHTAVTTTKHHYPPPTSGLELELLPPTNWASSPRPNSEEEAVTPAPRGCSSSSAAFGGASSNSNLVFEQTTSSSTSSMPMPMSMPSGPSPTSLIGQQQQQLLPQWAFGPLLPHSMPLIMPPSSSPCYSSSQYSCSSLRPPNFPLGPTFNYNNSHPHPHPHALPPFHYFAPSSSGFINDQFVDVAGPSSQSHHASTATLRVVDPPRRPHSGIWFMLQASLNQAREPFLPQIPKNYLRIKDGRMTVRLLLKYLVSKLKLESESEIEITCRGQQLLPFLTLQHVRDNIWTPRDNTTTRPLLSDSSTTDHVMVLHYGRSTC